MAKHDLDAVIASNYDVTARMLGSSYFKDLGLITHGCREYNALVGCDKKGEMIASTIGKPRGIEPDASTQPLFEAVVCGLIEGLKKRGLDRGRIGLDMLDMPSWGLLMLQESLPEARFVDATWVVRQDMGVKKEHEIKLIEKAVEITEAGFKCVVSRFRECLGRPQSELVFRLLAPEVNRLGGEVIGCNLISTAWELYPSPGRTEPLVCEGGIPINFDLLVGYQAMMCDIAFRGMVGEPDAEFAKTWELSVEVKDALARTVKPGMTAAEAESACLAEMHKVAGTGWDKQYWAVHGVGFHVHEFPQIGSPYPGQAGEYVFEPGMVLSVESIAEEAYVMTKDGLRRIGEMPMRIYQA
jgi:Xaa-Pro aminopeptidase